MDNLNMIPESSQRSGGNPSTLEFRNRRRYEEEEPKKDSCCCLSSTDDSSDEEEDITRVEASTSASRIEARSKGPNDKYLPLAEAQNSGYYIRTSDRRTILAEFTLLDAEDPFETEQSYWHVQEPPFCKNGFIANIPPIRKELWGRDPYNHKKTIEKGWSMIYIPTEINGEKVSVDALNNYLRERSALRNSLTQSEGQHESRSRQSGTTRRRSIFNEPGGENERGSNEKNILEGVLEYIEEQKSTLEFEATTKRREDVVSTLRKFKDEYQELLTKVDRQNEQSGWSSQIKVSSLSRRKSSNFKLEGDVRYADIAGCLGLERYPHWLLYRGKNRSGRKLSEGERYPSLVEAIFILLENPTIADSPIRTDMVIDDSVAKTLAISYDQEMSLFIVKLINPTVDNYAAIPVRNISELQVESTNCGLGPFSETPVFCCGEGFVRSSHLCHFCYCPPTMKWPCGVTTKCYECGVSNCCCAFPCCCLLPCAYCPTISGVTIYPTSSTWCERFRCSLEGLCWWA